MSTVQELVDIVKKADAFPYESDDPKAYDVAMSDLWKLVWKEDGPVIGYMQLSSVVLLLAVPENIRGPVTVNHSLQTIRAFELPTERQRTDTVNAVMWYWHKYRKFDILSGWRDEKWPVYGSNKEVLYSVERSGTGILGVMRYGVHMTGYVLDETAPHGMRIWVPRRAANKSTYPGMLDNTVAGGLMTGEDPFECIVREADEEASIPESVMRERAQSKGMVSYIYVTDERAGGEVGQIYPETQWIYDLELPADVRPVPKDGEVAEFYLWTVDEVKTELAKHSFKPNCALVLVEFLLRHKLITGLEASEAQQIYQHLWRQTPFPGPHQTHLASMQWASTGPSADKASILGNNLL